MAKVKPREKKLEQLPAFITAQQIRKAYFEDEFYPYVVYGGLGRGKSSYALQLLAAIYGEPIKENGKTVGYIPDWEAAKKRVVFKPEEFLQLCRERKEKDRAVVWDDAGYWLYSLDYYKPFVKAVGKYLSVARTDWGAIIFTTPHPDWIIRKAWTMPNVVLAHVIKASTHQYTNKQGEKVIYKNRDARVYKSWRTPDGKKRGVRLEYIDKFNAMLPDEIFHWYQPKRDSYAREAKKLMTSEMEKEEYQKSMGRQVTGGTPRKKEGKKTSKKTYTAVCDVCGNPVVLESKPEVGEKVVCNTCRDKFPDDYSPSQ